VWTFASDSGCREGAEEGNVTGRRQATTSLRLAECGEILRSVFSPHGLSAPQGARSVSSAVEKPGAKLGTNRRRRGIEWGSCARQHRSNAGLVKRGRLRSPSFRESGVQRGRARTSRYVAEHGWVASRSQISSRHALQKQRADGSERRPSRSNSEEQSSGCGR